MAYKTIAEIMTILKFKMTKRHNLKNVFAYELSVNDNKYLPGDRLIYVELNENRANLRRKPQNIADMKTEFNGEAFNFNKINPQERLLEIDYGGTEMAFIINKSPLTYYHMLICQDVSAGHPQKLTRQSLSFCISIMQQLAKHNKTSFRIGYNSPGALASVNHLHLHFLDIPRDLYIDEAKLKLLADDYIYCLTEEMPTEAICFIINRNDDTDEILKKLNKLYEFVRWLHKKSLPHNLFITASRDSKFPGAVKVFVFTRTNYCLVKDQFALNIGFCELAGFVVVGDKKLYNNLTEQKVLARIKFESGNASDFTHRYFKCKCKRNKNVKTLN